MDTPIANQYRLNIIKNIVITKRDRNLCFIFISTLKNQMMYKLFLLLLRANHYFMLSIMSSISYL